MRILVIGLSAIIQKRLMPAFAAIDGIARVDIASRGKPTPDNWPKHGIFYSDYETALAASNAELVYISLPNSDHMTWILASLAAGKHVIVDKPATLTLADAKTCLQAAKAASRLLAEATVFSYHPHMDAMRQSVKVRYLDAQFIIPPMPAGNFRNVCALGGGSLLDMGPYAAAVARLFTDAPLESLCAAAAPRNPAFDVDMGFSFLARFADGLRYTGHFGFDGEYQNRLLCVGEDASILSERLFSLPADMTMRWQARSRNQAADREFPAADSFASFLRAVLQAIETTNHENLARDLLADADFRDQLAGALNRNRT